jgi:hypothetical protein
MKTEARRKYQANSFPNLGKVALNVLKAFKDGRVI